MELVGYNMIYIKYLISVILFFPCLVLAIDLDVFKANIDKYDVELNFKDGGDLDILIENEEINNIELLQKRSTVDFYFKMILSYKKGQGLKPTGLNIYSKKNDQLFQTIDNLQGFDFLGEYSVGAVNHIDDSYRFAPDFFDHNGIEIDYNFDGNYNDFYIARAVDDMEDGPIIYRYYSYDEKKKEFIYLNLDGRYIDFDPSKKIAKRKKVCEINNYSAVILNETYRFKAENSNYTLTNSTCTYKEYESFRGVQGQSFKISRQCSQKEMNFCINENELDKDFD
ncbi:MULTISPECIES: hypothetical protein [unclassified Gilliamella]|uniref:hypothetical protein n=1 Tax=unclassified Gilliamella TaxID=2685620 RepID=UPI000A3418F8|nr:MULTISPECIES: hypothetical protein [unclassified Gilliamella]OTQ70839.1 hypothetical protein B6C99_12720 [Gilliamella sp. N-G2]OTQ78310.1 hypothetical protein B6D23_09220 [Gilliamella sp. N-W3]